MGNLKDNLYRYSPIFVKKILLNLIATKNSKKRYTAAYYRYLEEYLSLWKQDRKKVLDYQALMLSKLLEECYHHVVYYQKDFKNKNITLSDIQNTPYEVLSQLDLLSKVERKEKVEQLINTNPDRLTSEIGFTSGTSGSPTKNYVDDESTARAFALWTRFHININITKKDKNVRLSGRLIVNPIRNNPPFWLYSFVDQQLFMSAYHLKEEHLKYYVAKLNSFKPKLLDGYPSALYIIAQYINKKSLELDFTPVAIAATAETLYDYQRIEIEKAFKCKIYNQYASSEGSPFITECQYGKLHINEDSGVFEFLNAKNKTAQPGEVARMVVTSFRNWKTPLLRYDIQDTVLLAETQIPCQCGCQMHYVEKIIGREDDILWTEEKGYVGRMDTAYKGLEGISQSQLIQQTKDLLIVNQIVDEHYTPKMNQLLLQNLKDRLGEKIEIKINIVNEIALSANGKFNAVKRKFKIDA